MEKRATAKNPFLVVFNNSIEHKNIMERLNYDTKTTLSPIPCLSYEDPIGKNYVFINNNGIAVNISASPNFQTI